MFNFKTTNITLLRDLPVDDSAYVDEEIFAVILGLDEAETLLRIEIFHGSAGAHLRARRSTASTSSCSCTKARNAAAPAPCVGGGKSRDWDCCAQRHGECRFFTAGTHDEPRP